MRGSARLRYVRSEWHENGKGDEREPSDIVSPHDVTVLTREKYRSLKCINISLSVRSNFKQCVYMYAYLLYIFRLWMEVNVCVFAYANMKHCTAFSLYDSGCYITFKCKCTDWSKELQANWKKIGPRTSTTRIHRTTGMLWTSQVGIKVSEILMRIKQYIRLHNSSFLCAVQMKRALHTDSRWMLSVTIACCVLYFYTEMCK